MVGRADLEGKGFLSVAEALYGFFKGAWLELVRVLPLTGILEKVGGAKEASSMNAALCACSSSLFCCAQSGRK